MSVLLLGARTGLDSDDLSAIAHFATGTANDRSMRLTVSVALALALSGCYPMFGANEPRHPNYPPPTFADYVYQIGKQTADYPVPTIPTSLRIAQPVPLISPFLTGDGLGLASIDAEKICLRETSIGDKSSASAENVGKRQLRLYAENNLSFRALESLRPDAARPLRDLPAGTTKLDSSSVVSDEIKDFDAAGGTIERRREIVIEMCAPAPGITAETKFIAVTMFLPTESELTYKDINSHDDDRVEKEQDNQMERMSNARLVLVAITDGQVDLNQ